MGSASNPLITRHIHGVNYGYDGNFYACTGDGTSEMHFLKCVYDSGLDSWTVTDLLSGAAISSQQRRAIGVYEKDGYIYWGSDGSGVPGIFKTALADVNNLGTDILLNSMTTSCYTFLNVGNLIFAGMQVQISNFISEDYGETWTEYVFPSNFYTISGGVWYNELYKYFANYFEDITRFEE